MQNGCAGFRTTEIGRLDWSAVDFERRMITIRTGQAKTASCRFALIKNVQKVALEAGNSPAIIFKHYREITTEDQASE